MKKYTSLFLALVLTLGLVTVPSSAAGGKFKDTSGHWAEAAIDRWSGYGVVQGSEGMFDPNGQLTRAQIATILSNTLGLTDQTATNPFADLDTAQWYAPAILRCHAAGLMQGDGVNVHPDDILTRQEAMVLLSRALDIAPVGQYNLSSFNDAGQVDDWAAPYVCAMTSAGIVNGVDPGVLAPKGNMTRASLMTVLDRSIVQYINQPGNYTLTPQDGIILIAAGNVTLSGVTPSDILVTRAASRKSLAFNGARITGSITVEANNATITTQNSTLPNIRITGKNTTVGPATPQPTPTAKPDATSDKVLTITEKKDATYEDGVYKTVKLDSVLRNNNAITLKDMTVQGDLIIQGGCGSSSKPLTLTNCDIQGKIVVDRSSSNTVHIVLNKSTVEAMEVDSPVSVETKDKNCSMGDVTVLANTTFKGSRTSVKSILVSANAEDDVTVTVEEGTVSAMETENRAEVTLKGNVKEITTRGNLTFSGSCETEEVIVPDEVSGSKTLNIKLSSETSIETLTVYTSVKVSVTGEVGAVIENRPSKKLKNVTISSNISDEPHNWNSFWSKGDPSYHWHTCKDKNCDAIRDKEAHDFDNGKVTTAATCTKTGVRTYTCSVCGQTKTESIPKTSHNYKNGKCTVCGAAEQTTHVHSYGDWVKADENNHKRTCTNTTGNCDKKEETEPHSFDENGKCTVCGYEKSGTEEHKHSYIETVTEEPTCTKKGKKTLTCECGDTKTEEIPTTEHSYENGSCTVCGAKDPDYTEPTPPDSGDGGDSGEDNKGGDTEGGEPTP